MTYEYVESSERQWSKRWLISELSDVRRVMKDRIAHYCARGYFVSRGSAESSAVELTNIKTNRRLKCEFSEISSQDATVRPLSYSRLPDGYYLAESGEPYRIVTKNGLRLVYGNISRLGVILEDVPFHVPDVAALVDDYVPAAVRWSSLHLRCWQCAEPLRRGQCRDHGDPQAPRFIGIVPGAPCKRILPGVTR